ncbi:sulfatase [Candidatus Sumerlaeota bacterium]
MKKTGITAAAAAAGALPMEALGASAAKETNVLLIMADDLGWRDTSCYGSTFYETPHIDALAASGMRFTDAYAANPLCSPTRASVLTGQYPLRHGLTTAAGHIAEIKEHKERTHGPAEVRGSGPSHLNYLDPKYYTLGKAMKDAGYATAFFGKWHMGCKKEHWPESHGFDHVRGGRHHPGPPGKNGGRKFYPPWTCNTLNSNVSADTHVDDLIADETISYMKKQNAAGKPFFICHWPYSVHAPFQSKPELIAKWKKKVDPKDPQHSPTMAAMIEVLDSNIGRLMQALKDNGMDKNTVVIFTSDNGGNMYDTVDATTPTNNFPLRSGKGNNYEGGVRVPMIVRCPGTTKPGSASPVVTSSVDHYPAILEMTGQPARPDNHKDGVSYVPALKGQSFDRGPTLCDMPHPIWATLNIPNTFVREGDWKMYRFWHDNPTDQSHRYELYNVRKDISEKTNLATDNPDRVKKMSAVLDKFYKDTGVLGYNPNSKYNKRTVGAWFATSDEGKLSAKDGALVMKSEKPGFTIKTRFFPPGGREGWLAFEARSSTETPLKVAGPGKGKTVTLAKDWKNFDLSGKQVFIDRNKFAAVLAEAGQAELRNVRILTKDKTEMMRYTFY